MRRVIAIAGASGSGKSTLAAALLEAMGNGSAALLPIDAYYHDLSHLAPEDREAVNFDHPDALDLDLFATHIEALRSGRAVECPTYDFTTHCRRFETVNIPARETILLEGILVACRADLRALADALILSQPMALRHSRRVYRDQYEREGIWRRLSSSGRAEDTFAAWGALAEEAADLVVDGSEDVKAMTRLVIDYLSHKPDRESCHC